MWDALRDQVVIYVTHKTIVSFIFIIEPQFTSLLKVHMRCKRERIVLLPFAEHFFIYTEQLMKNVSFVRSYFSGARKITQ